MISLDDQIRAIRIAQQTQAREMREITKDKVLELIGGMSLIEDLRDDTRYLLASKGRTVNAELLELIPSNYWNDIKVGDDQQEDKVRYAVMTLLDEIDALKARIHKKIRALKRPNKKD